MNMAHQPVVPSGRQKIIYIGSLPGSGTTILGLLLPQYTHAVSLGEVEATLRHEPERVLEQNKRCTCGKKVQDCQFWGPVLEQSSGQSSAQRHAIVMRQCQKLFPGAVIVDSAKSVEALKKTWLAEGIGDKVDVRVIHIVRDYRGWSLTQRRKHYRRGGIARWKFLYWHCLAWYVRNKLRVRSIRKLGLPMMTLSYESLVFNTQEELKRIAEFGDFELLDKRDNDSIARMHDCHGNGRIRRNAANYAGMRYDYRWMLDVRFTLLGPLLIPMHLYWRKLNARSGVVNLNTTRSAFGEEKR